MNLLTRRGYLNRFLQNAKARAQRKNVAFDLDIDYLQLIVTDACPIFKTQFLWQTSGLGKGHTEPNSPSLDRIVPELGYVKGNMVFISHVANKIKSDATEKELYAVADWLHDKRKEVLNAFKNKHAPVPGACDPTVKAPAAPGPVSRAGTGKDCDGAHHYQGELFGTHPGGCT
jgi:hypothetical protein